MLLQKGLHALPRLFVEFTLHPDFITALVLNDLLKVYGSSRLVQTLLQHDLVDELWLKIFPITLGSGKRLFAESTNPSEFKLTDSKVSPSGVIIANYERAGEIKTGSVA